MSNAVCAVVCVCVSFAWEVGVCFVLPAWAFPSIYIRVYTIELVYLPKITMRSKIGCFCCHISVNEIVEMIGTIPLQASDQTNHFQHLGFLRIPSSYRLLHLSSVKYNLLKLVNSSSFRIKENINSLDPGETPSYSAYYQGPSSLHRTSRDRRYRVRRLHVCHHAMGPIFSGRLSFPLKLC